MAVIHHKPIATPCDRVMLGQVVLCKMKGHPLWPAKVIGFENNLISIKFYGDHTTYKAALRNFFKFEESTEVMIANLKSKKRPLYKKAVHEAEVELKIPAEISILTRI